MVARAQVQVVEALPLVQVGLGGADLPVVVTPDLQALREVLLTTRQVGAACDELRRFRESCITGSTLPPSVVGSHAVWTVTLQLYMAAYCKPVVYKDLWNQVISAHSGGVVAALTSSTSAEVDTRVSMFTQRHAMDLHAIVDLMLLP